MRGFDIHAAVSLYMTSFMSSMPNLGSFPLTQSAFGNELHLSVDFMHTVFMLSALEPSELVPMIDHQ